MMEDKAPAGPTVSQAPSGSAPARRAARRPRRAPAGAAKAKAPARKKIGAVSRATADLARGGRAIRRAIERVGGLSKKTARRLARDWQDMDRRKKIQLVATLIAALGAAAAPLVRSRMKKK